MRNSGMTPLTIVVFVALYLVGICCSLGVLALGVWIVVKVLKAMGVLA